MQLRPTSAHFLWLGIVLSALVGICTTAHADNGWRASGAVRVYADDDHMTVVSPAAGAQWRFGQDSTVDIAATVDVVSGASIDVVSEASPTAIREARAELGFAADLALSSTKRLRGGAAVSNEHDYLSLQARIGGQFDFALHNTTIDLAYVVLIDSVGSATDDDFSESKYGHQVIGSFTQVLSPRTYLDLIADVSRQSGYLASPYRTVVVDAPQSPAFSRVAEVVPEVRFAGAGRLALRHLLSTQPRLALHAGYRFYADDWSIESHTANGQLLWTPPANKTRFSAAVRAYTQSRASFHQARYSLGIDGSAPELRTRDRTLGKMHSATAGIAGEWVPWGGDLETGTRVTLQLGFTNYWFVDFPAQATRLAGFSTVAVSHPL